MYHLKSAQFFSQNAKLTEAQENDVEFINHRSYVMNSIISCACCLEAYINEVFIDFSLKSQWVLDKGFTITTIDTISTMWNLGIPRTASYKTLEKYNIFLVLSGKPKLNTGKEPYQSVLLLTRLRNEIVHYEPEFFNYERKEGNKSKKFEEDLKSKIKPNPYFTEANSYFPDQCLSSNCTEWACDSTTKFLTHFINIAKTKPIINT